MHQLHAKRLRLVLNQTLRMVVGVHTKHTGESIPALYTEMGIPSVESLIEGRRARCLMSLDTYISEMHMGEKHQSMVEEKVGSSAVNLMQRSSSGSKALQRTLQ
ncbi:hypothetical protein GAYE_PCTG69G1402 [Galdieria yellowstonensis]|uniref:Uncharacterized protein n=1 Tax=Galdieria yellowstonensis TaxID=3028027 RepID=A0AAV9I834_9RHOD|nr:hypothetical protein GAYE_PCTG69G1402 [Galdieria yellowstonensis]